MTSAVLGDKFTATDEAQGQQYETELNALLDDLLNIVPKLQLTQQKQDEIHQRLAVALRRAFVTISKGPGKVIDARSISDPKITEKYQQVSAMLAQGVSKSPQMSLINDPPDPIKLPANIPNVTPPFDGRQVDVSHVPPNEVASVFYDVSEVLKTQFNSPTVTMKNAYWPVLLPIRTAKEEFNVRYELVFNDQGDVRVERLGKDAPLETEAEDPGNSISSKLKTKFGLAGIEDGTTSWTDEQLHQIMAVYDLIPSAQQAALSGVTLVRDTKSPEALSPGLVQYGYYHAGSDNTYDSAKLTNKPPHIHYFNSAFQLGEDFTQQKSVFTSAPGIGAPGGEFALVHEVGHAEAMVGAKSMAAREGVFATLARNFGFLPFTDYGLRNYTQPQPGQTPVHEWFAETYALFVTDPTRLIEMNPKMFSWFKAGMPNDPKWMP
jgi:hypothetical protein